jgi:hypothetical protein
MFALFLAAAVLGLSPLSVHAQEHKAAAQGVDILPAKSLENAPLSLDEDNETHPPIRLTPDKSEIVRLDAAAATVLVGNPAHLSVLAENSKTLVLVGRAPGATHFAVLDSKGGMIMQRHVIVASPKEKYVRIRSSCASGGSENCQATRVYYCPDMCHEVVIDGGEDSAGAQSQPAAQTAQDAAADMGGGPPPEDVEQGQ